MRKPFLFTAIVIVSLALAVFAVPCCAQIPYQEYYATLEEIIAMEEEAEEAQEEGEFGRAYSLADEAEIMRAELEGGPIGAARYFLMAKEWIDKSCSPTGKRLFDEAVAQYNSDYKGAAIKALEARDVAMRECSQGMTVEEEPDHTPDAILFLALIVIIVVVGIWLARGKIPRRGSI